MIWTYGHRIEICIVQTMIWITIETDCDIEDTEHEY